MRLWAGTFAMLALVDVPAAAQTWSPDTTNSQYRNPIIFADYSDPDVHALRFAQGDKP